MFLYHWRFVNSVNYLERIAPTAAELFLMIWQREQGEQKERNEEKQFIEASANAVAVAQRFDE